MLHSSLQVTVIGGGIGGLCLAQGLKAAGVNVAVYERNPSPTDWLHGYQININSMGSQALRKCLPPALWEAFLATAGKPSYGTVFLTEHLREVVVLDEKLPSDEATSYARTLYPVSRIALRHLLLAGLDHIMHYNKIFTKYEHSSTGKVTAFFTDGTSVTGDVLVAADGASSRVRQQYLPQAKRVETNALTVGGKLSLNAYTRSWLPHSLAVGTNVIMPLNRYSLYCSIIDHEYSQAEILKRVGAKIEAAGLQTELLFHDLEDYVLWSLAAHRNAYPMDVNSYDGGNLQQLILTMIKDWHPDLRRVVLESDPTSVSLLPLKTSVPVEPWQTTNVTLLGDAIHSMPPLGGMGANTALRDARALAQILTSVDRGEASLLPALSEYEAQMQKYGFAAVRTSIQNTQRAISTDRIGRLIGRASLRFSNAFPALQRKDFADGLSKSK